MPQISGITIPVGTVTIASDFPYPNQVVIAQTQFLILDTVTDNDPTRTNTGQSFLAGDYIVWNGVDWARVGNIATATSFRGSYDASSNLFPSTGGSGSGDSIVSGDFWVISVAGTLGGEPVVVGTLLFAITDNPGQTAGNWVTVNQNFVVGSDTSTDNAICRYDGITGKLIQNSVALLSDAGALSGLTQLDIDNIRVDGNTISSTDSNGNVTIAPNGSGKVDASSAPLLNRNLVSVKTNLIGSPYSIVNGDSGTIFTNEGAVAEVYLALPTAVAGLTYSAVCQSANGIRFVAASGDSIAIASAVSGLAGFASSTTTKSTLTITAINATEWIATSTTGTWTVT